MTFGLGYFRDGVWVDHLATDQAGVRDSAEEEHDANPLDAVHQWLSCCKDLADPTVPVEERDVTVRALGSMHQATAGSVQR